MQDFYEISRCRGLQTRQERRATRDRNSSHFSIYFEKLEANQLAARLHWGSGTILRRVCAA